jgi:hypothetical protein
MGTKLPDDIAKRVAKIAVDTGVGTDEVLLLMIMTGLNVWDSLDAPQQQITRPKGETLQ